VAEELKTCRMCTEGEVHVDDSSARMVQLDFFLAWEARRFKENNTY